jgi:outer membrane biosynthesis protein TonB
MGRLSTSLAIPTLVAVAALALSACGSGDDAELLPGATASEIDSNLSRVEQLVAEGECLGAESSAAEIGSQVDALTGVDEKLQRALAEGADKLAENVAAECEEAPEEEETVPTIEEAEEAEPEKKPKPEKPEKPKKEEKEADEEEPETDEGPTLPPQSEGKGEEKGQGEGPPAEPGEESPSGGVGPGIPAEGE